MLDRAEIQCPACGRTVHTSLQAMRRSGTARCSMGHSIKFDGTELDRGMRQVDREVNKFTRDIEKMNRDMARQLRRLR